jgi:hypothetical protein
VALGTAGAPARSSLGAISNARGGIMSEPLLDAAGRRRSPARLPQFHAAARRATRDCGTRPARPRSKRS